MEKEIIKFAQLQARIPRQKFDVVMLLHTKYV